MRIGGTGVVPLVHLSYCSNIHPGENWPDTRRNIHAFYPAVKARVAPQELFGVGLRLSAVAAAQLSEPQALREFAQELKDDGLYLFTVNGFPFGTFHAERVKEAVYLPDWRSEARLIYTNQLADLLTALAPSWVQGSISTVPGAFAPTVTGVDDERLMACQMARHVAHLVALERRTGCLVRTALEPEPCCYIETLAQAITFFEEHLLAPETLALLGRAAQLDRSAAEASMRRHLGICLDLCHAAVEFEDIGEAIGAVRRAGILLPKVQVSAGLRIANVTPESIERLQAFADGVYLHQVIESTEGRLQRYLDLPQACAGFIPGGPPREWRVHFHVPIFLEQLEKFATTRSSIEQALELQRASPYSDHFEVETYTFDVLPAAYREADVVTHLSREVAWAAEQLRQ